MPLIKAHAQVQRRSAPALPCARSVPDKRVGGGDGVEPASMLVAGFRRSAHEWGTLLPSWGSEVTRAGSPGVPAGGGNPPSTLRAHAGGCGRRQGVETVITPHPTTAVTLAEDLAVLRDVFGRAPPVRIKIPGQQGDSSLCSRDQRRYVRSTSRLLSV
jgi:hypothetical protein